MRHLPIRVAAILCLLLCIAANGLGEDALQYGVIIADYLNLRATAATSGDLLGTYEMSTRVQILQEQGGWYQVITPDGKTGYMARGFIELEIAQKPAEPVNLTGVQQVGTPYLREFKDTTLTFSAYYPELTVEDANTAIRRWVSSMLNTARAIQSDTPLTVDIGYDSYWVQGRYSSILALGSMYNQAPEQATPNISLGSTEAVQETSTIISRRLAFSITVDEWTGKVLSYTDIFGVENVDAVLSHVRDALTANGEIPVRTLTPDVLQYATLTNDGVLVYVPQVGMMHERLIYIPYALLVEQGLMAIEVDTPENQELPAPKTGPMIALTFDDGPGSYTNQLLDVLAKYDVKATFYLVGNRVKNFQEATQRIADEGHEIGTHTFSHAKLTTLSYNGIEREIQNSLDAIASVTSTRVTSLRPPYGSYDKNVRDACEKMGLTIAMWNLDTDDWNTNDAANTYNIIMEEVEEGCIILCHELKSSNVEAMERVIPDLLAQGYQFVTVTELLSHSVTGGAAGTVYSHLNTDHLKTDE